MAYEISFACPACQEAMQITELTCPNCETRLKGAFQTSSLYRLSKEQLQFAVTFIKCRGNIKEVERELKISYPTVRSRLEQIISDMGFKPDEEEVQVTFEKGDILDSFANGDITFEETIERLKGATER